MTPPTDMPKLSETFTGPRDPDRCQGCGARWVDLSRWWECDESDRPTKTVVITCKACEKTWITPHPRLYRQLAPDEHHPGSMELCQLCRHRDGLTCPQARIYGGQGVAIAPAPSRVFVRATTRALSGLHLSWRPARECDRRLVLVLVGDESESD